LQEGKAVEMENFFSRFGLDIIGKAVFNYDFDSLTHDDPVIQVGRWGKMNAAGGGCNFWLLVGWARRLPARPPACLPFAIAGAAHTTHTWRRRMPPLLAALPFAPACPALPCPAGGVHDPA